MKAKAGFSMLEALTALAIAAICIVPLMTLQRTFLDGMRRHEAALQRTEIQRNALVLLREVNPTDEPEGERTMPPDMTLTWTSTEVSDPKLSVGFPTGDGSYTVQLYRLDAQVARGGQTVIPPFSVERVGWTLGQEAAPAAGPGVPAPGQGPGAGRRG